MQYNQNRLLVVAYLLSLVGFGEALFAQQATRPVATARVSGIAATQAGKKIDEASTFLARIIEGPVVSLRTDIVSDLDTRLAMVQGPVWDDANKGLWIVIDSPSGNLDARLIDPATGQEQKRLSMPRGELLGHDGVGLWLEVQSTGKEAYRRIRTTNDLSAEQKGRGTTLPEDLPSDIDARALRTVSTMQPISICTFFRGDPRSACGPALDADPIGPLHCLYLDLRTITMYGLAAKTGMAQGAGYLWFSPRHLGGTECLRRLPLSKLIPAEPITPSAAIPHLPQYQDQFRLQAAAIEGDLPPNSGDLTWDGQRLWTLSKNTIIAYGNDRGTKDLWRSGGRNQKDSNDEGTQDAATSMAAPPHLIMIDVGFARKPDTGARYKKALAFEKANGTAKALPMFEKVFADDPSAAEIRNHVAWALATRPEEPYHNIERALELVRQALEWQPWNPEMWDTLAEIYWRKGDAKLAVHLEAKAINLNPHKTFYWRQYEKFQAGPTTQEAMEPSY